MCLSASACTCPLAGGTMTAWQAGMHSGDPDQSASQCCPARCSSEIGCCTDFGIIAEHSTQSTSSSKVHSLGRLQTLPWNLNSAGKPCSLSLLCLQ